MNINVLHKESAGSGEHSREKLAQSLRSAGFEAEFFSVKEGLSDPKRLAEKRFTVVAGGDGTVRDVSLELAHTGIVIAPLPVGTANNIARSLRIPTDIDAVIPGWRNGSQVRVDTGVASGPWGRRRFLEGIGIGLIGRSIRIIEEIDSRAGHEFPTSADKLHRDLCVLTALGYELQPVSIELAIDGATSHNPYVLVEVLNIGRAGPGVRLVAETDHSDGLFDVVTIDQSERGALTEYLHQVMAGSDADPRLPVRRTPRVELRVPRCEVRLDDEILMKGPRHCEPFTSEIAAEIVVEVDPGAVTFLLPG